MLWVRFSLLFIRIYVRLIYLSGIFSSRTLFVLVIHRNPLVPQVLSSVPSAKQSSLPLLRGLALVFPMSTATLYVYQPNHLYMLHKHLHESFIVTPPNQSQSDLGTICHVEEVVSVGADGA